MAFFLIVPSVMILGIVLVHGAASHFGLQLKYKSLILSAVASMAISFAAIKTTPFFGKIFLIKLGILILAASVASTALNVFLLRRDAGKIKAEVKPPAPKVLVTEKLYELPEEPPSEAIAVKKRVEQLKAHNKPIAPPPIEPSPEPPSEKPIKTPLEQKTETLVEPKIVKPIEKPSEPPPEPKIVKPSEPPSEKPPVKDKTDRVVDKRVADLVTANEKISAVFDKSKPDKPKSSKSSEPATGADDLDEIESHLHSLSDILDFAYNQKESGNFKLAILAYQKALERYRADDYAPFIAIDLSSIYKEQAAYSKAIKVCEEALTLPAVTKSSSARNEFANNLAYLRTVQSVLSRHRVLSTPFSKISRQLLAEIDADFKKSNVLT